ncbi:hypothetical protein DL96DRAFT_1610099 [Flagelloscypha sp. PMI_526]|nr:hypothetical protein DL96DRAFT_1610099 [Flagelloscypha sp. PMI_526]
MFDNAISFFKVVMTPKPTLRTLHNERDRERVWRNSHQHYSYHSYATSPIYGSAMRYCHPHSTLQSRPYDLRSYNQCQHCCCCLYSIPRYLNGYDPEMTCAPTMRNPYLSTTNSYRREIDEMGILDYRLRRRSRCARSSRRPPLQRRTRPDRGRAGKARSWEPEDFRQRHPSCNSHYYPARSRASSALSEQTLRRMTTNIESSSQLDSSWVTSFSEEDDLETALTKAYISSSEGSFVSVGSTSVEWDRDLVPASRRERTRSVGATPNFEANLSPIIEAQSRFGSTSPSQANITLFNPPFSGSLETLGDLVKEVEYAMQVIEQAKSDVGDSSFDSDIGKSEPRSTMLQTTLANSHVNAPAEIRIEEETDSDDHALPEFLLTFPTPEAVSMPVFAPPPGREPMDEDEDEQGPMPVGLRAICPQSGSRFVESMDTPPAQNLAMLWPAATTAATFRRPPRCTSCGFGFGFSFDAGASKLDVGRDAVGEPCEKCEKEWEACREWFKADTGQMAPDQARRKTTSFQFTRDLISTRRFSGFFVSSPKVGQENQELLTNDHRRISFDVARDTAPSKDTEVIVPSSPNSEEPFEPTSWTKRFSGVLALRRNLSTGASAKHSSKRASASLSAHRPRRWSLAWIPISTAAQPAGAIPSKSCGLPTKYSSSPKRAQNLSGTMTSPIETEGSRFAESSQNIASESGQVSRNSLATLDQCAQTATQSPAVPRAILDSSISKTYGDQGLSGSARLQWQPIQDKALGRFKTGSRSMDSSPSSATRRSLIGSASQRTHRSSRDNELGILSPTRLSQPVDSSRQTNSYTTPRVSSASAFTEEHCRGVESGDTSGVGPGGSRRTMTSVLSKTLREVLQRNESSLLTSNGRQQFRARRLGKVFSSKDVRTSKKVEKPRMTLPKPTNEERSRAYEESADAQALDDENVHDRGDSGECDGEMTHGMGIKHSFRLRAPISRRERKESEKSGWFGLVRVGGWLAPLLTA